MTTLLIDNYDSFTYNLFQALAVIEGVEPVTLRNDDIEGFDRLDLATVDQVVISPGPGHPGRDRDFGLSQWAVGQTHLPVLGVCLGHQGIGLAAGAEVVLAPAPFHGRPSSISHSGDALFEGIESPFVAVRYHSLVLADLPATIAVIAATADGIPMAISRTDRPHWGVQFHPESIDSPSGPRLLANFLRLAAAHAGRSPFAPAPPPTTGALPPVVPAGDLGPSGWRASVRELAEVPDAASAYDRLFRGKGPSFWLDSSRLMEGRSRFSVIGGTTGPLAEVVTYRVADLEGPRRLVVSRADGTVIEERDERLWDYLEAQLADRAVAPTGLPLEFAAGYVGYLGYELKADGDGAPAHRAEAPDAGLIFCDRALVMDHRAGRAWLLALGTADDSDESEAWFAEAEGTLADLDPLPEAVSAPSMPKVTPRHSDAEYRGLIERCREATRAGESYELCLTNTFTVAAEIDPWDTYRRLRAANPAPYGAYLELPEVAVLSSSPEGFMKISSDGAIEARPIKGTRPRGSTPVADAALVAELADSEKEQAENRMIVDLLRNDVGRVAQLGSVTVPAQFEVETFETVHQLVSTVTGIRRADRSPVSCVASAFPGGSMTGAPKLRTMELLDDLEGGPRGVYSGALGYFSLDGAIDLSMVIRTVVVHDRSASVGAGGAITWLSDGEQELAEVHLKAAAALRALGA